MTTEVITAAHRQRGVLYAAVDPSVRFIVGAVRETRFGARLAPFKTIEEARSALCAAGAVPSAATGKQSSRSPGDRRHG